jgi:hypothetical protein
VFNNSLPVSSLFCKILLLRLPRCLPACICCPFCSYAFMLCGPCPFAAQFSFCSFQLLHSDPSSYMNHLQQHPIPATTTTYLFSVLCIYIFCAPCACNACNTSTYSHHANILHNSSSLSDHHRDSSASLVIFPLVQHHCMLC